ncbi:MAG: hypothetical protein ACXVVK_23210, partial [Solirubrobacteraceae bacterium]
MGEQRIGMIGVANKEEGYRPDDERLPSTFANQVAVAIDNPMLHEHQQEMIAGSSNCTTIWAKPSHSSWWRWSASTRPPAPASTPATHPDAAAAQQQPASDPRADDGAVLQPGDRQPGAPQR